MQDRQDRVQWVYGARNNKELEARYDEWAKDYETDLDEAFGWTAPEVATELLAKHVDKRAKILDAGVGTGLVGNRLQAAGYGELHGIDLSQGMLEEARDKGIYRTLRQMTLGEPLDFPGGTFDAVISVGVFTTGHAPAHAFDELIRITKGGGHIVFSLKTDSHEQEGFGQYLKQLVSSGKWQLIERSPPYRPLPKGEPEVVHRVWVFQSGFRAPFSARTHERTSKP